MKIRPFIPDDGAEPDYFTIEMTREELERMFILSYRGEATNNGNQTLSMDVPDDVAIRSIRRFEGEGRGQVLIGWGT